MLIKPILCLLLLSAYESSGFLELAWKLGKSIWKISGKLGEVKSGIDGTSSFVNGFFFWEEPANFEVLNKIGQLATQMHKMQENIEFRLEALGHLVKEIPSDVDINGVKRNFGDYVNVIDDRYTFFREYAARNLSRGEWRRMARRTIGKIEDHVGKMRHSLIGSPSVVHGSGTTGLILRMATQTAGKGHRSCSDTQSLHHLIKEIISLAMMTEIKAITMLSAYQRMISTPHDAVQKISVAQKRMEQTYMEYLRLSLYAMQITPEVIRRCDPESGVWVRGESYMEIERLDQVLLLPRTATLEYECHRIVNMDRLKRDHPSMTEDCDGGQIYGCIQSLNVRCAVSNDVKQYQWMSGRTEVWPFGESFIYGQDYPECKGESERSSCVCSCRKEREHAVSLGLSKTDTDKNMVVTGARLIRKNKTLWIQLKQGKLLPNADIDPASQSWIPVPDDFDASKEYITMSLKRFSLVNEVLTAGYALTGVQFITSSTRKSISLKLHGQQFDAVTGMLLPKTTSLPLEPAYYAPNTIILFRKGGIDNIERKFERQNPIYTKAVSVPNEGSDWIELHTSELKYDVGQSVLPLFDIQPVETTPPSPVAGLGMYHKNSPNYAGFIGLQLHSLSYKDDVDKLISEHVNGTMFGESNIQNIVEVNH